MEMDYNLKKLANFFTFSLSTDPVVGTESTLNLSVKKLSQIFSCSKKYITHKKRQYGIVFVKF